MSVAFSSHHSYELNAYTLNVVLQEDILHINFHNFIILIRFTLSADLSNQSTEYDFHPPGPNK